LANSYEPEKLTTSQRLDAMFQRKLRSLGWVHYKDGAEIKDSIIGGM
jgi:hypothetical protein